MKIKIKLYDDGAKYFHDKEVHKVSCIYICLAIILIDFVSKKDENYYSQVNTMKKEKKVIRYITVDLDMFFDDF